MTKQQFPLSQEDRIRVAVDQLLVLKECLQGVSSKEPSGIDIIADLVDEVLSALS